MICLLDPAAAATLAESGSPVKAQFGEAVALSGTAAVVAPFNATSTASSGPARVFYSGNAFSTTGALTPAKTLLKNVGTDNDRFGSSVSIVGTTALVGAAQYTQSGSSAYHGAAFLYRDLSAAGTSINHTVTLLPLGRYENGNFGASLALDAARDAAIVGAPGAELGATRLGSGVIHVYTGLQSAAAGSTIIDKWALYASDGTLNANLGTSVATWGGHAIGGAPNHSFGLGAAYLWRSFATLTTFTRDYNVKFTASDGVGGDRFGEAVALSGNASVNRIDAIVGAPRAKIGSSAAQGAAYYFSTLGTTNGTVPQTAKLVASNGRLDDWFGTSVAISDVAALVGAPKSSTPNDRDQRGSAYLFHSLNTASGTVEESVEISRYYPTASTYPHDRFGQSVALMDGLMIIGQPTLSSTGIPAAAAHTLRVEDIVSLDTASASRELNGYEFRSRTNWMIGSTQNQITMRLGPQSGFRIVQPDSALIVGNQSSASNNRLIVDGTVNVPQVRVGAELALTVNNELQVNGSLVANQMDIWRQSVLSGTGTITSPVNMTGSLRPGQSGIGTLTISRPLTWNYNSASPWVFDLGPGNTSDRLVFSSALGDFLKGAGSQQRVFDFGGSSQTGTYTLVTWGGNSDFVAEDFAATNLGAGRVATFSIVSKSLQVTVAAPPPLTALQTWRQTHFGSPANTGNGANDFDFDNDGIANLLEFALGTNPASAASRSMPVAGQSTGRLTLSFTPREVSGLTFKIQTSSSLMSWADTTLAGLATGVPYVWTDSVLISDAPSGRRFVRLLVSE